MNKKEMDIILSRIERLSVFLEDNTLYNHANESRQESKRKASFLFKTKSDKYFTLSHTYKGVQSVLKHDLNAF